MKDRPLLVLVSDIHLTDTLTGGAVEKSELFERFWTRIAQVRGERSAHLCFVGDLFDLVRSPTWLSGAARPYRSAKDPAVAGLVEQIVDRTLEREAGFFSAIRKRVASGQLMVHYVLGNHDRLLAHSPAAQRKISLAMSGEPHGVNISTELEFPEHGVLAYHGHVSDPINSLTLGGNDFGTIGDAIGSELILRFPREVKRVLGADHPGLVHIDDIDDVRPVYAVPAWVRQLGINQKDLLRPVGKAWGELIDEFLANDFVDDWLRSQHRRLGLDLGKKLRLLLELSRAKVMAHAHDERLTSIFRYFQHAFDGKMSGTAAAELTKRRRLHYVVNGHSHFASMVPLGHIHQQPAVYFNTGTWRTVHQIGHDLGGRPSFLPYDAMSYLVFFPDGDAMNRDYEWWTGAMVSRGHGGPARPDQG